MVIPAWDIWNTCPPIAQFRSDIEELANYIGWETFMLFYLWTVSSQIPRHYTEMLLYRGTRSITVPLKVVTVVVETFLRGVLYLESTKCWPLKTLTLLVGHYIQPKANNTGPQNLSQPKKTKKKGGCTCPICLEVIQDASKGKKDHDAIYCEGQCNSWLHRGCAGLPKSVFTSLQNSPDPFYCPTVNYQAMLQLS